MAITVINLKIYKLLLVSKRTDYNRKTGAIHAIH